MRADLGNIMRSKGYLWLAGRDDQLGEWGHAGAVLEVSCGGPWMATLPADQWYASFSLGSHHFGCSERLLPASVHTGPHGDHVFRLKARAGRRASLR